MAFPKMYQCLMEILLITMLLGNVSAVYKLTILHTNDIHARVQQIDKYNGLCSQSNSDANKCYGGYARIKTQVAKMRQEYPNSLLLDGGDQYQGTLWYYLYRGVIMSHFMNLVGYDAMGLGNHEFDNGPEGLAPFLNNATFSVLSCNTDASKTPELSSIKKSAVFNISGEKIGVIGYTTKDTPFISDPGLVEFHSEIDSIQAEADRLMKQGINKIIAVGHAGYAKDQEIAQKVRGVDVIVGGHTNSFLYSGTPPSSQSPVGDYPTIVTNPDGDKVLVVQDYAYGKYLGELHVTFDQDGRVMSWKGNPVLLDHTVARDPGVLEDVNHYLPELAKRRNDKIGVTLVDLIGDRTVCRRFECNLGNMITDAMVRQNQRHSDGLQWSSVAIALLNGGGIRADLRKGEITVADVLKVQPFGNTVDIVELKGQTLLAILEVSASNRLDQQDGWGGFLQVSGLRVIYDQRRQKGSRVVKVDVLCTGCLVPEFKPLDKLKTYMVLMQDYLIEGSDGYELIKNNIIKKHTIGNLDSDILMDYIKENTPITTGLEGRIRFLEDIEKQKIYV